MNENWSIMEMDRENGSDSDEERANNAELFGAIRKGCLRTVESLLKKGVKVNIIDRNNKDNTPLHYAIERGCKQIAEAILAQQGTNINHRNSQGNTPLHIACSRCNEELIELLIKNRADVGIKNNDEKTPLDLLRSSPCPNSEDICQVFQKCSTSKIIAEPLSRIRTISEQQREVHNKLETFVKTFVCLCERLLEDYYERLKNQQVKGGKWSSFVKTLTDTGKSASEQETAIIGIGVLNKIISSTDIKHNRNQLKKLTNQLYTFKNDPDKVRQELVRSAVEIFQCFESQLAQITVSNSWKRAFEKVAHDGVNRIFNYYRENTEDNLDLVSSSITKGIILGESKTYKHTSINVPHFRPGHTVMDIQDKEWNTAELFQAVGIVTIMKDGTPHKYYKKKTEKSCKYGYRLLFSWESGCEVLHKEYEEIINPPEDKHTYILATDDLEALSNAILSKINCQEPTSVEKCLETNLIEQLKEYAEESFNEFKENFNQLSKYISDNEKMIKEMFNEVVGQRHEIAEDVKEIKHGMRTLLSRTENIEDEPIWFEVRESVVWFTALSLDGKGRQDMLDQITADIQQGIVVISGLPGMGKTELAIKYARQHSQDYSGNVVWINAETIETTKDSFERLATEVLEIPVKEEKENQMNDRNMKSIVRDVYKHFIKRKRKFLLIFDNAENYDAVKDFLPLDLPSGSIKPDILITSNTEWESNRVIIKSLPMKDFDVEEAKAFLKVALEIKDDSQNEDIETLVETLHSFPLALQQAVDYMKEEEKILKNIDPNQNFKVSDYLQEYEEKAEDLLKSEIFLQLDNLYKKSSFTALQVALDKVKNNAEHGEQALEIINIVAYFASTDVPVKMFLELTNSDKKKLGAVIQLLKPFSVVRGEGCLNVHGLVRQVRRLELEGQQTTNSLEERTLEKGLELLGKQIADWKDIEQYTPHIVSVWDRASKYVGLIERFIVNELKAVTSYFHIIAENSSYQVFSAIIQAIEQLTEDDNNLKRILNKRNKHKETLLHVAAHNGRDEVVKLLISKGAVVNIKKEHGWTPLHLAAKNGYNDIVLSLLTNGADVDKHKTGYGFSPLHLAARNGYSQVVKTLLEHGADPNATDKTNFTALHFAVKNGRFEVVEELILSDKININAETKYKLTPLHFASREGYIEVVKVLLKKGANVNSKNIDNFTPLHLAVVKSQVVVVEELLKNTEIEINSQTTKGNTPLHFAAQFGYLEVVKVLIGKKADVNIHNHKDRKASDLAANNGHQEVANYLISLEHSGGN